MYKFTSYQQCYSNVHRKTETLGLLLQNQVNDWWPAILTSHLLATSWLHFVVSEPQLVKTNSCKKGKTALAVSRQFIWDIILPSEVARTYVISEANQADFLCRERGYQRKRMLRGQGKALLGSSTWVPYFVKSLSLSASVWNLSVKVTGERMPCTLERALVFMARFLCVTFYVRESIT